MLKKKASYIARRHHLQEEINTHSADLIQRSTGNQRLLYLQGVGKLLHSITSNVPLIRHS